MSVDVLTFGCRLNAAESDVIRAQAIAAGHRDLAVVNSCAVTAEAMREARKAVRRFSRDRPGTPVVVTGCAAAIEPQSFADLPGVTSLVANAAKTEPATWRDLLTGLPPDEQRAPPDQPDADESSRTRTLLPVQNGCDHRCTFCIIPFGRGPSRSVPVESVLTAAREAVDGGARELVLTGVDLTSWGADLPATPRLGALVKAILRAVPDLDRLRLSSVDSMEVDDDLLDALATERRLMPHLHLSLQAGDDIVLKRMKRRHSRADAIRFCGTVRKLRPDIAFGADLIAGFPTETDDMFRRSLDLVAECGLTYLHVFPYSPRPGTPAARMPAVPASTVRERAARLREAGANALRLHLDDQVGRRLRVLTERGGTGRTECFAPVRFHTAPAAGIVMNVTVAGHDDRQLLVTPPDA